MSNFRKHDELFVVKSEDPYIAYEGKIIRKIIIQHIGFERNVIDTSKTIQSMMAKLANRLHKDSKQWVVRDNLFIREGEPVNSYRLADNERYLRDLDFILDSRIYIKAIAHSHDSVDVIVVTRDVFSLGASVIAGGIAKYNVQIQEANLGGNGQKVQVSTVFDTQRNPFTGYEFLYQKTNVLGSFINATLDYSQITTASAYGTENQTSYYFQLARLLFMPYTRWAGGLTLSHNKSENVYSKSDTIFEQYRYNVQDYWVGYSFGHKKKLTEIRENRNRKFIAIRGFQQRYSQVPLYFGNPLDRQLYHDRVSFLTQLTFFRQDFYKTRYVLGFGRTEDIPYGYRISFTSGWEYEQEQKRPYAGVEIYKSVVNHSGVFFTYTLRVASYYNHQYFEDALTSINLTRYSKLYVQGKSKIRHQLDLGFAQLFNQKEKRALDINDVNGITNFRAESLVGNVRFNSRYDIIVFTPWKLIGFNIATSARVEASYLIKDFQLIHTAHLFTGISAALRVRNENLVFNTIEARILYYPRTIENISHVGFTIQANLKIRYPTVLVNAPATVYN